MFSMSLSFPLQRLQNMVARIAGHAFMLYYQSLMDTIIAPWAKTNSKKNVISIYSLLRMSPNSPSSYSLVGNLSGMLLNTDMVLDYPRPQPPTFLNIGGIQVTLISLCRVLSPSSGEGEPRPTTWKYKDLHGRWNIKSVRKLSHDLFAFQAPRME